MTKIYFTVYQTNNLINGKIYIGVHKTKNLWDSYLGSGEYLIYAIEKYGRTNFKKEIICWFEDENSAYLKESELVNQEFVNRKDTYNIKLGGLGGWNKNSNLYRWMTNIKTLKQYQFKEGQMIPKGFKKGRPPTSQETKIRISNKNKGRKVSKQSIQKNLDSKRKNNTLKLSEETKKKISIAKKGRPNGHLGMKRSDETKRKMSLSRKTI